MGIHFPAQVCESIGTGGVSVWDDVQRVPYAYFGVQWVGYDDPRSIKEKVSFALTSGRGNVIEDGPEPH